MYWNGLILLVGLERKLLILHVILNTSFDYWLDSANVKKMSKAGSELDAHTAARLEIGGEYFMDIMDTE